MRPQTLISLSTALFLGLMTVVFTGIEAAPVKMQAAQTKPAKATVLQIAKVNIVQVVLKPARTKGKLNLKMTLHNPTATKATGFTVKVLYKAREVGKMKIKGLGPRARVPRSLTLRLPKQKGRGRQCVTVGLSKPRGSKLKLGPPRKACLTSPIVIRKGIGTSPTRKVGTRVQTTARGKLRKKSRTRVGTIKGKTRLGVKYITIPNTLNINGQNMTVTINPGQTATVNWKNFPTTGLRDNPNQVTIRVRLGDFPTGTDECKDGTGDLWRSGPHPGLSGNITIPLAQSPFQTGQTYKVKACLINNNTGNTGDESNVVTLRYSQTPDVGADLVVSDISLGGNKVGFRVGNIGNLPVVAPHFPGTSRKKLSYRMEITYVTGSGNIKILKTVTRNGNARIMPNILYPGKNVGGGAPLGDGISQNTVITKLTVCVNENRRYPESNFSNNCLTKTGSEIVRRYYSVKTTLKSIRVHDDGDNISKGDWIVIFRTGLIRVVGPARLWPSSGSNNVDSGSTINPNIALVTNVLPGEDLYVHLGVIDCDKDTIPLPYFTFDRSGIPDPNGPKYRDLNIKCSGEEFGEFSGNNDRASKYFTLRPDEWRGKSTVTYQIRGDGLNFTATIEIDGAAH